MAQRTFSPLHQVCVVIGICVALSLSACASLKPDDPRLVHSAQQNEKVAETWRQAGHPEMGERFATQAEKDRAAMKKGDYGFFDALFDTLFTAWLDQPLSARSKR
jgi:hypothetical protein